MGIRMKGILFFVCIGGFVFSQIRFEKLLWDVSPGMPSTVSRVFVNAIEYNKHYYVFGFNDGYKPTLSGCNNLYDGWLVFKCDSVGNLIKALRIGGPLDGERMYFPAIQTRDKGFLIPGQSSSFSVKGTCDSMHTNANFIKLDSNLNIQWLKSVGGRKYDIAGPVKQLKNGQYMAFGMSNSFGHGAPYPIGIADLDIYIMKLDTNGNLLWSMTYGTKTSDILFSVAKDEEDNFYVAGLSLIDSGVGNPHPFVFKIDSAGTIKWANFYYNNVNFYANGFSDINVDGNKLYLLQGYGNYTNIENLIVIEMDKNGNILSVSKSYVYVAAFHHGVKSTNNYFIRFLYWLSIGMNSGKIIMDNNFNTSSSGFYQSPFLEYLTMGAFKGQTNYHTYTSDNDIITGSNVILNLSNYTDRRILFMKMNNNGNVCIPDTGNVREAAIVMTYTPVSAQITSVNQGTVLSWTPSVVEGGVDSTICFCPALPVSVQTSPVNCFANGSATLLPSPAGNYIYQWSPPVSNTNTATNLPAGTYSVTISDSLGCQHLSIVTITTNMSFPLTVSGNTFVCSSDAATLVASGAVSYTWSTGSNDSSIVVYPATSTIYTLTASAGVCTQTLAVTVSVNPTPTLLLSMSSATIGIGDTLHLSLYGGNQYSFSPSENIYLQNNILSLYPRESITYCIRGEKDGCYDTVCVFVKVDGSCFDNELPNVFTPNGDGVNDEWRVRWRCPEMIKDFRMEIYDRWGVKMYESMQWDAGWDGRTTSGEAVPSGTYYYLIEYTVNDKKQTQKGYMTLLR